MNPHLPITQFQQLSTHRQSCYIYILLLISSHFKANLRHLNSSVHIYLFLKDKMFNFDHNPNHT